MTRYLMLLALLVLVACGDSTNPPALEPASFQVLAGAAQVDTVGRELKDAIAVRVIDTDGATSVPNYPITWTPLDGGEVFATVVFSGSDGIARQRYTLGTRAGMQRIRLTALDGETGAVLVDDTVTAEARPDLAARLALVGSSVPIPVGDSLVIELRFKDEFENNNAPCADGGPWQRLTWESDDSSVVVPTGQTWADETRRYGWLRGVGAGTTTIRVTAPAACVPLSPSDATTFTVVAP